MNLSTKQTLLTKQLQENLKLLEQSLHTLNYSYKKALLIKVTQKLSLEEMEVLEALTARFARTSDILTQKVFKSIFVVLQEDIKTFIDGINFLEKIEIVDKADKLLTIRALRNEISHEYSTTELNEIFKNTIKYIPVLLKVVDNTKKYIETKF